MEQGFAALQPITAAVNRRVRKRTPTTMAGKKQHMQLSPASKPQAGQLRFTHFGAAGWEITDGETVLLLDPYFSRLRTVNIFARTMPPPSLDSRPVYGLNDILVSDTAKIDEHVNPAHF